jgi:hypothetical protein
MAARFDLVIDCADPKPRPVWSISALCSSVST